MDGWVKLAFDSPEIADKVESELLEMLPSQEG